MESESGSSGKASGGRRAEVWRVLRAASKPLGIAEIADQLEIHPNTVRFHLKALVDHGRAEQVPVEQRGPGRPASRFRASTGMDPDGARHYRLLAEILIKELGRHRDARARAIAAGRELGRSLELTATATRQDQQASGQESLDVLVAALDELGFSPELADDRQSEIHLRSCPFLELAREDARIVCAVHLGLMRGVLEGQQADVRVERLLPFAEPDLCLVDIAPAAA